MMSHAIVVLHFLREELYAPTRVLERLLSLSSIECQEVLSVMRAQGYLNAYSCPELDEVLWGITIQGQRHLAEHHHQAICTRCVRPAFRYPVTTLFHKVQVQYLIVDLMLLGGEFVQSARGGGMSHAAIPDAVVAIAGRRYAIEYERVLKSRSRYPDILSARLQAIKQGEYAAVVWVLPRKEMVLTLQDWLLSIEWVSVASAWVQIRAAEHHPCLHCVSQQDWCAWLGKIIAEQQE